MTDTAVRRQISSTVGSEQVSVDGVDLFTRSVGDGPREAVVIHGGPSASHASLLPAFDDLASGRRLRYYDQRGCGASPVSPRVSLDWQNHVSDLRGLLDYWNIDEATLVGHSWGALLALLLAIEKPDRVSRMLLVTPASITAEGRSEYLDRLGRRMTDLGILRQQKELLKTDLRSSDPQAFRRRVFELSLAPYMKDPERIPPIAPYQISHRVREAVWRSLGNYDFADEISKLTIPALVIHGRHDPIPLTSSQRTAALLDAEIEIFEESGHMPFFEEHERFTKVAESFLTEA